MGGAKNHAQFIYKLYSYTSSGGRVPNHTPAHRVHLVIRAVGVSQTTPTIGIHYSVCHIHGRVPSLLQCIVGCDESAGLHSSQFQNRTLITTSCFLAPLLCKRNKLLQQL